MIPTLKVKFEADFDWEYQDNDRKGKLHSFDQVK